MATPEIPGFPGADIGQLPALRPSPGIIPDFIEPYSRGDTYSVAATIIVVLMLVLVTNRQYTKMFIIRKFGWDDLTCLLAELSVIGYYVNCQYEVTTGRVGTHQWNVPLSYILSNEWLVPSYIGVVLVPPAITFIKLTFYLMYLQVFRPLKWLRICIYLGASSTTAFYVATELYWLVSITPRKGQTFATVALSPAQLKSLALSVPVACVGLATDLYLLVLPITAVLQLQLPTRRKVGVIMIFMTGIAACISSTLGIYYRVLLNRNGDFTWNLLPVNIASIAEMSFGLCCVSMPAFSKMLAHHLPPYEKLKSWMSERYNSVRSNIAQSSSRQPLKLGNLLGRGKTDSSRSRVAYLDLENNKDTRLQTSTAYTQYELGPMKSVRTLIGTGRNNTFDDDVIHCQVDLEQNVHRPTS